MRVAVEDEALLAHHGLGNPLKAEDGSPAVIHVLPLHRGAMRRGLVQRAVAAVFVVLDSQEHHTSVDAISLLYGLCPPSARSLPASPKAGRLPIRRTASVLPRAQAEPTCSAC